MAGTVGARDFINGWVQAIAALNPASNFHGVYPPSARVEIGDVVICVDTAPGGVLERYELTGPSGRTVAEWISHPGRYTLQVDGRDLFATSERGRWDAYGELPSKDLAADALRRLMFVPAQRNIPGTVMARRVEVPSPSDPDLGMAIFTRRNDDAPEFFLRDHAEHSYVCATHSPVFINAAEPEACWLVTRDERGTAMRSFSPRVTPGGTSSPSWVSSPEM